MRVAAISNKINICLLMCLMAFLFACSPKAAQVMPEEAAKPVSISSLEVGKSDGGSILTIKMTEGLQGNYTVIKLSDPPRVVVEMPKVDVGKFEGVINVDNGGIAKVATSRLNGVGARMEVILASSLEHQVKAEGNTLEINFAKPQTTEPAQQKGEETPMVKAEAPQKLEEASQVKTEAAPSPEEKAQAPSATVEAAEKEVPHKTLRIMDVKVRKSGKFTKADIITDGEPFDYNVFELKSPNRVIVDIRNARAIYSKKEIKAVSTHIKGARLGRNDGQVRVVFDYKGVIQPYAVSKGKSGITIFFGKKPEASVVKIEKAETKEKAQLGAEAMPEKSEAPKVEVKAGTSRKTLTVKEVKIEKVGDFTRADIITDREPSSYKVFDLKSPSRVVVDLTNAREIAAKKRIKAESPYIEGARLAKYDGMVRVVFDHKGEIQPYEVVKGKDGVSITFGKKPETAREMTAAEVKPEAKEAAPAAEVKMAEAAKPEGAKEEPKGAEEKGEAPISKTTEAGAETKPEAKEIAEGKPEVKAEVEPEKKKAVPEEGKEDMAKAYKGQKVTLEFKDADIKNIFRIIAEVSGYNMIIDNAVTGKVTIRLVNVPWDQALDIILETNGLGMKKVGNVIRVLPMAAIKKEEDDKLAGKKAKEKLEDLVTKLVPVSYAKAADISAKLQGVMSDRGKVTVDDRTNTLILKDIQKSIDEAEKLVKDLDTPTRQISIEARIVEASNNFTRNLGVNWGTSFNADAAHGNPTGYYFPNSYGIVAGGGGVAANVPSGTATGQAGGAVGINFGSINNTLNLDLRLNALELQNQGKIISSPKIVTLDNKEASIQQGVSIPFQTTSASGTQTQFVDANLNLTVTPHVTADGRLMLKIKASKNSPDTSVTGAGGAPSINKNEATTEILVNDGDTTVIGGIYTIDKNETTTGIPYLRSLPLVGWLFRSKANVDNKSELLIFITPRIVRDKPVQNG